MTESSRRVRYAVVGLGWIAQTAMLPAFTNAATNSELVALVSGDKEKLAGVGAEYGIDPAQQFTYAQYDDCLKQVDAVYVATTDIQHREFTERALRAGVHVICEKPMAVTVADCEAMNTAAEAGAAKLMIAYRLHFDESNLQAAETVNSGAIGHPRIFTSTFSQQLAGGNARLSADLGDGSLYDIGLYCLNAARYLFRAEPTEVFALTASGSDPRFRNVEEMTSAIMRFPDERLAQFTCSFGAAFTASYQVIGTKGDLRVNPAYGGGQSTHYLTSGGETRTSTYPDHDHFAPQLLYFSDCILQNRPPEPDGQEGLIDVAIIEAMYQSARERRPIKLNLPTHATRPNLSQATNPSPTKPRRIVKAESPTL